MSVKKKEIKRRSYYWNTISGMINAGQSAIILVFISYKYTRSDAGVFSIGYAIALFGMTLAKYGQRNYQVTDATGEFSFEEYRSSRWVTVATSLLLMISYIILLFFTGNYTLEKMLAVILICMWKQIDAVEDVYYGMYQQRGRLDIGAKRYSERLILSTILFCVLLLCGVPIVLLLSIEFVFSAIMAGVLIRLDIASIQINEEATVSKERITKLLKQCILVCIASVLAVLIGNLPKYLIDFYLDDSKQAIFGYLMMPSFVIMVLSTAIFQPIIRDIGIATKERKKKILISYVKKQLAYISIISLAVILLGSMFGIKILDLLYHVDLTKYTKELTVLFVGGGFYAISQFIITPIIAIRKQKDIALIYIIISVVSVVAGSKVVSAHGIWGAAVLYLTINMIISILLLMDYSIRLSQMKPLE